MLEGERVEAGAVVVTLVDDDARLAVEHAAARVEVRRAEALRAEAALARSQGDARVERAALALARDELERKRGLVPVGGIPAGEVRALELGVERLVARVESADLAAAEARAAVAQAEAEIALARAEQRAVELALARMQIRAPAAGVVLARLVVPGSRVGGGASEEEDGVARTRGGAVLALYDPASLQVRVDVPLADAGKVGVGSVATLTCEALPEFELRGRVVRVVHEADIQRNTVQYKVALESPPDGLKPEMLTRARLHGAAGSGAGGSGGTGGTGAGEREVLLVPRAALVEGEGSGTSGGGSDGGGASNAQVWVVDVGDGRPLARRREVRVLAWDVEGYARVVDGLRSGDRVILDPPAGLRDGAGIRVQPDAPAAANAGGAR